MQWRPVRKQPQVCQLWQGIGVEKCAQVAGSSTLGKLGDFIKKVWARHPDIEETIMQAVDARDEAPRVQAINRSRESLVQSGMAGKGGTRGGVILFGQPEVDFVRRRRRNTQAPRASSPFISFSTNRTSRLEPQLLRVLFLRRMRLPLPLSARACRCSHPLHILGHHRPACAVVGTLGRRGFPLENAAAKICREAVGKCDLIRDLDLGVVVQFDARRLQVLVNGLPLFQGVDTTLVCPLTREGEAKPHTATTSGVRLEVARRRKEARYPELAGNGGGCMVVLAGEVGGRFSDETAQFLSGLASDKVRDVLQILQGRAHAAWMRRWSSFLACAAAAMTYLAQSYLGQSYLGQA